MSPRGKTILLIAVGVFAVLLILAILSSDDEDQNAVFRGLSSILRMLTLVGRAF